MHMFMQVRHLFVLVFVRMLMGVFMSVQMLVLMRAFHGSSFFYKDRDIL